MVTVSQKELQRVKVIENAVAGRLKVSDVAAQRYSDFFDKFVTGRIPLIKRPRNGSSWLPVTLYYFAGPPDGSYPASSIDKRGNLYSTTPEGGTGTACQFGCGTVFKVSP
jgi:hypothetical protein